jgi:hypothetical protein
VQNYGGKSLRGLVSSAQKEQREAAYEHLIGDPVVWLLVQMKKCGMAPMHRHQAIFLS